VRVTTALGAKRRCVVERRCKDAAAGLSRRPGEVGGSLIPEARVRRAEVPGRTRVVNLPAIVYAGLTDTARPPAREARRGFAGANPARICARRARRASRCAVASAATQV
jgi:hypothetical protein